jgi:tol-pal system protein YbgF
LFLPLLPACWVPLEQGQAMEADLVKLKAEIAEQRRELEQSEVRASRERDRLKAEQDSVVRRLDGKVKEVGDALEALNRAARKTGADLGVEVEQAQREISRLRGLVEEAQARSATLEQAVTQLRSETDSRLSSTDEKLRAWEESRRAAEASPAKGEPPKPAEKAVTKESAYEHAKATLDGGDTGKARALFADFLGRYKDDALAANAQYWIGESHYGEKSYNEAILEFRKVWERWPKSDKAPDAVLKIAYSFLGLGSADNAKLFLDEVVRSYPKSGAAKLAKEKLEEFAKPKGR